MHQAVVSLKEEEIISGFWNNPHFSFYRISESGVPAYANNTFLRVLGFNSFDEMMISFEKDELFRKNFSAQKYQEHLKKINNKDGIQTKWKNKSGRMVEIIEYVQKSAQTNGSEFYYDCIAEDVTEKKIIDELMSDIIGRDYAIIKALPDVLFILEQNGNILDYKSGTNSGFPISSSFVIGKNIQDVFPLETSQSLLELIKQSHSSGQLKNYYFSMKGYNDEKHYEARIVKSHKDEVIMLLRDVTVPKQNELQILKVADELKQINDTKDKFVSIIAHDVRTPIIALIGYAEILAEDIDFLQIPEIKEFASSIVDISKQTITLLTNLLEWSRLQTGRIEFNPDVLDAYSVVQNTFALLCSSAEQKNIDIINNLEKGTFVLADENMIQTIFNNLVTNAIKFTENNGHIIISSEHFEKIIKFSVKDDGRGMDEEQINMMFDMNKSFTTPGTTNEKGTGLGMILCKEFVEKHGGKIWVESSPQKGSEFFFTIPSSIK